MSMDLFEFAPEYVTVVTHSVQRLRDRVIELSPNLGVALYHWVEALSDGSPEDYFLHPFAFPTLLLPWWLDEKLNGTVSLCLQRELIYSSIAGYYAIRLIDDVMDAEDGSVRRLLPATAMLQAEFQGTYAHLFPAQHEFWQYFYRQWTACHAAAFEECELETMGAEMFRTISAKKVCAATIPLMAVCQLNGIKMLPADWQQLFNLLSQWHQFYNDFFDWKRDLEHGMESYFIWEAKRCAIGNESMLWWVAHEGFDWAVKSLDQWMFGMCSAAGNIGHPPLARYLAMRQRLLTEVCQNARPGLQVLKELFTIGNTTSCEPYGVI